MGYIFDQAAQPKSGSVTIKHSSMAKGIVKTKVTLTAARIPVTDGTTSGSYGTLKIGDFVKGLVNPLGSFFNITATAEGSALTTAAGDAAFKIAFGGTAIAAAADATLAAANKNLSGEISITNSGGTGTGNALNAASAPLNGRSTAVSLNLNWSGSAATIDADSTIDITGTYELFWMPVDNVG